MAKGLTVTLIIWAFNAVYRIVRALGYDLVPVTIENIIKPMTTEEREEFLKADFNEPVKLIIEGCKQPPSVVTGFQRFIFLLSIRNNVKLRTAVKMEIVKNPDILKTPVDGPLVIVGLARSGTTILQRLLACDPQFVSPMLWEMVQPTPAGRPEDWRTSERYKAAVKMWSMYKPMFTAELQTAHPFGVEDCEECIMLIGNCFLNTSESIHPAMKKWNRFQLDCPKEYQRKTYEFYKMALQCLFYNNLKGGKKLLLKAPVHLLYLETYKEVFPKAKFIFTYRHLRTVLASAASLIKQLALGISLHLDKKTLAADGMEFYKRSCARAINAFRKMPEDSFVTMGYSELMEDPLASVRRIYSHFNLQLTPEVEASMQRYLVDNPQNKFGKHVYSVEDHDISEADIRREFAEFIDYFKDSPEKLV